MQKKYSKPQIMFESFVMSTSIAGDCDVTITTHARSSCGMDFSGLQVFLTGMGGCTDIQVPATGGDGEYAGICYHVFTSGKNLFNS